MVRRSLIAAALLAVAAPLSAQSAMQGPEEWVWTADRPDGNAPLGVFGGRNLATGELELGYRFSQMNSQGVWFGSDSLDLATTLQLYNDAPLTSSDIRHKVRFAYGVSDELTIVARGEFAIMERQTLANNALLRVGAEEFGDVEVGALYRLYASGSWRMHAQVGAVIPTGASTTYADTTMAQPCSITPTPPTCVRTALPYDMRPGGGVFGAVGGLMASLQNEVGSVGAQFRMRMNVGSNNAGTTGFTPGNHYEGNAWAAYNLSDIVSVSAGARYENWGNYDGADSRINPAGDPHNLGALLAGQRATMPIGLHFLVPGDGPLAGHRLSVEGVYAIHHDYEGPQLGLDWGLNLGWSASF